MNLNLAERVSDVFHFYYFWCKIPSYIPIFSFHFFKLTQKLFRMEFG